MAVVIVLILFVFIYKVQKDLYKRYWNAGLDFSLSFSEKAVFEGQQVTLTEVVSNRKKLPLPYVNIKFRISHYIRFTDLQEEKDNHMYHGEEHSASLVVLPNRTVTKGLVGLCTKRGCYTINNVVLSSSDLLMGEALERQYDYKHEMIVYPKLLDAMEFSVPFTKMLGEILVRRYINPDNLQFKGIREYQQFDSLKQINYKATAKTGRLMSNIYDYTDSQEITIILNLKKYSVFDRDFVHENAIRIAATLSDHFIGKEIPVGVICLSSSQKEIKSGVSKNHLFQILDFLARIELNAFTDDISDLLDKNKSNSVILISSYYGSELVQKFTEMKSSGRNIYWIIPKCASDVINMRITDDVVLWEVQHD